VFLFAGSEEDSDSSANLARVFVAIGSLRLVLVAFIKRCDKHRVVVEPSLYGPASQRWF
jgi:hypothetical protein